MEFLNKTVNILNTIGAMVDQFTQEGK